MSALAWLVGVGLVLAALGVWVILLYNRLVSLENMIDRAWANVDVALKQRADEVKNLVAVVQGYAAHERALFEDVAQARATLLRNAPVKEKAEADARLRDDAARLFAVAEAYPELRASDNFLALQKRISALEDLLADRREYYNDSVALFNTRIQEIPDRALAAQMRLVPKPYFRADA